MCEIVKFITRVSDTTIILTVGYLGKKLYYSWRETKFYPYVSLSSPKITFGNKILEHGSDLKYELGFIVFTDSPKPIDIFSSVMRNIALNHPEILEDVFKNYSRSFSPPEYQVYRSVAKPEIIMEDVSRIIEESRACTAKLVEEGVLTQDQVDTARADTRGKLKEIGVDGLLGRVGEGDGEIGEGG